MALEDLPFQNIRESALKRIRLSEAPAAALRQQAINAAGLKTSGVGQLPLIQAARNRALQEAGIEESISGQEAQQLGSERLASLQHQFALEQLRQEAALKQDLAGTAARRAFQSAITGKLLDIPLGAFGGALTKRFGPKPAPTNIFINKSPAQRDEP